MVVFIKMYAVFFLGWNNQKKRREEEKKSTQYVARLHLKQVGPVFQTFVFRVYL